MAKHTMTYFKVYDCESGHPLYPGAFTKDEAEAEVRSLNESYPGVPVEMRAERTAPGGIFTTTAPVDYDGFSTRRLGTVNLNGRDLGVVEVEQRDWRWQRGRYASGQHPMYPMDPDHLQHVEWMPGRAPESLPTEAPLLHAW